MQLQDPDIREVAPKIMSVLCERLETYYIAEAERDAADPSLERIPPLTHKARVISGALQR